jgi:hypothetical protein
MERRALSRRFSEVTGYLPDLTNPKTFSEKMQVFKLNWRHPFMADLTDKVKAKDAVRSVLGDEWIIPTLWHGGRLPSLEERKRWPTPYVLKANQGSGNRNCFVRSPSAIDWPSIEIMTERWMRKPHGGTSEWAYTQIEPQLLVEPMLSENITDYKMMVFRGRVEYMRVHLDRVNDHRIHFYDREWRKQPLCLKGYSNKGDPIAPPRSLGRMIDAAEKLLAAYPFPYARIDFYDVDGSPKFGEFTLYSDGGFKPFLPEEFERQAGDLWGDVGRSRRHSLPSGQRLAR